MAITGKQPKAYNEVTGMEDDVFFPANTILFDDGYSFQQKLNNGSLVGPQGPQGPQGEQGIQGIQGPIGPAANVTFRVQKNEAGGMPTVIQTGDSTSGYEITLGIPQGVKGDTGATGPSGLTPTIDTSVDVTTAPADANATASLVKRADNSYHLSLTIPQGQKGNTGEGSSIIIDDHMSDSSQNPVRNCVVKQYIDQLFNQITNGAPEALDTLKELALALGENPNFATTVTNQLANKVDKVSGKELSDQNYTLEEKNKLANIESGAQVNVVLGVKGSRDSEYSTNYISLDASNVGAASDSHGHDSSDVLVGESYQKESGVISRVDSVTRALGKLEYNSEAHATTLTNHTNTLNTQSEEIADITDAISQLQSITYNQGSTNATVSQSISDIEDSIETINDNIETQGETIATQGESISTINGQIETINGNVESQGTIIAEHTSTIASHESTLSGYGSTLSSHTSNISTINNTLTSHATDIGANTTAISNLSEQYDTLATTVGTLNSNLSSKQNEVIGSFTALQPNVNQSIASTDTVLQALLKLQARVDWLTQNSVFCSD